MSEDAFHAWRAASVSGYAADKVRVGTWSETEALERSERAFAELLPDGLATVGHHLRSIVAEGGEVVGILWFGPSGAVGTGEAFILDFEVAAEARGQGYGRAALVALEAVVRDLGYDAIGLHVFGDNARARALYRSSGYLETDVTMRKPIGRRIG